MWEWQGIEKERCFLVQLLIVHDKTNKHVPLCFQISNLFLGTSVGKIQDCFEIFVLIFVMVFANVFSRFWKSIINSPAVKRKSFLD
jgi:hypothetical protein